MKFMRRPDLSKVLRVEIAVQAFLGLGVYGESTRIANCYRVSRQVVYSLLWQLQLLFELEASAALSAAAVRTEVDRHILLLRMEGRCALERISRIVEQLGLPYYSVGYISQRLTAHAQALSKEALSAGGQLVYLLCDEICTLGQPILMTVEPRSLAILKLELADKRDAETWKKHWSDLSEAGVIERPIVVSDQGSGLVKGCALVGLTHHPYLFHLLRPVAMFEERFYCQALAAIAWEYERGGLDIGSSAEVIEKRRAAYEAARADSEQKIRRYDDFSYLRAELRKALELFDERGEIKDLASRQQEIEAILELMRELGCEQLNQALKSLAAGLKNYWGYYQRAEEGYQELLSRYPREVVRALASGWQLARQATNSKDYRVRMRLAQEAEFYFGYAASLLPGAFDAIRNEVIEAFDAEVRSSSLIENINSGLRQLLETCRGQVTQQTLELFAYVHNHRRFVRGKRAGKAPIEILTGKPLDKTWIESLLEAT